MSNINHWKTLSDNDLFKRSKFALDVYEGHSIIIAGGWDLRGKKVSSAVVLNTKTGLYKRLPDLPPDFDGCTGAYLNGYFYMVGCKDTMYRLNLTTSLKWEKMNLSFGIGHGHALVCDGKHLFWPGGVFNDRLVNMFDPETNKWTSLPQMEMPRYGHATAIVDQKMYVIGGANDWSGMENSSVEVFDIPSQTWSSSVCLPVALYGPAATVIGRWIIVTGGIDSEPKGVSFSFIFDTLTKEWIKCPTPLPALRYGHGCVAIQGREIILVGGATADENQKGSPVVKVDRKHLIPNWYVVKDFILLRRLLDDHRAVIKENGGNYFDKLMKQSDVESRISLILKEFFTSLDLDSFRMVLQFL